MGCSHTLLHVQMRAAHRRILAALASAHSSRYNEAIQAGFYEQVGKHMSHTIAISNEQYERLEALASQRGQTPEETLAALLRDALPRNGHQPEASDDLENSPLFQIAGIFTGDIEPGWTERHDEIFGGEALDEHAEEK